MSRRHPLTVSTMYLLLVDAVAPLTQPHTSTRRPHEVESKIVGATASLKPASLCVQASDARGTIRGGSLVSQERLRSAAQVRNL